MEGVLKAVQRIPAALGIRTAQKAEQEEHKRLVNEIRAVCGELQRAQAKFDLISDCDLVDACIFEMEALNARYRYLLGQAKQSGITEAPFAQTVG